MRIDKKHHTKGERRLARMLQESRLPFQMKVIINGREADFLIGSRLIVEVGNHPGENEKNKIFLEAGYDLLDFSNDELREEREKVLTKIKKICQLQK